jgi:antibiotic biosynthesis monooxygenase (ABM) superfamily enzyme
MDVADVEVEIAWQSTQKRYVWHEAEEPAYDHEQEPHAEKGLSEFIGHHLNRLRKELSRRFYLKI